MPKRPRNEDASEDGVGATESKDSEQELLEAKRARTQEADVVVPKVVTASYGAEDALVVAGGHEEPDPSEEVEVDAEEAEPEIPDLAEPTMQLTGHGAAVYACEFDPSGRLLASGSFDQRILLWEVGGECPNYNVLFGHKNAVIDLHWSKDSSRLVSCSADTTLAFWDTNAGKKIKTLKHHTNIINACAITQRGPDIIASASDDSSVRLWDPRQRLPISSFEMDYQATAVAISESGEMVFAGGVDGVIVAQDARKQGEVFRLEGHSDIITGLSLNPMGSHLLSNACDHTLRSWDVRPFCAGYRMEKIFRGHRHGSDRNLLKCAWSRDGEQVACGSADRVVRVFDEPSAMELYALPGHRGTVNDVAFHPKTNILVSASSDKTLFIGLLE
mmetsp:Transcript_5149/g.20546  ORF Transcript_5149/g.20546 Transcript_5149/m.20546 type:complete len:388 (-) Transcript_5149:97-1260(-)